MTAFKGRVGRTVYESTPHWPELPRPRKGAPNVVVVLFDDLGFAHLGCYGSSISTPNIDKLAAGGLRFTNFHTTALCSPTRAALLTGCNHHSVGMRGLANWNTGFPNCTGTVTKSAATIAEVLRPGGYSTFAVGKWHLTPIEQTSPAGPFDQWPLARGFDRYYGFLEGETDQWRPDLTSDNHSIKPPKTPEEGYHLSEDLVDQAIGMVHSAEGVGAGKAVLPLSRLRRDARAASGAEGISRQVPRQVRRRLGRRAQGVVRAAEAARHHPAGHRACAAQSRREGRGSSSPPTRRRWRCGCRRPSPASSITPTRRSAG